MSVPPQPDGRRRGRRGARQHPAQHRLRARREAQRRVLHRDRDALPRPGPRARTTTAPTRSRSASARSILLPSNLGIAQAASRFVAEQRDDSKSVTEVVADSLWLKLVLGGLMSILLFALAAPIANAYGADELDLAAARDGRRRLRAEHDAALRLAVRGDREGLDLPARRARRERHGGRRCRSPSCCSAAARWAPSPVAPRPSCSPPCVGLVLLFRTIGFGAHAGQPARRRAPPPHPRLRLRAARDRRRLHAVQPHRRAADRRDHQRPRGRLLRGARAADGLLRLRRVGRGHRRRAAHGARRGGTRTAPPSSARLRYLLGDPGRARGAAARLARADHGHRARLGLRGVGRRAARARAVRGAGRGLAAARAGGQLHGRGGPARADRGRRPARERRDRRDPAARDRRRGGRDRDGRRLHALRDRPPLAVLAARRASSCGRCSSR